MALKAVKGNSPVQYSQEQKLPGGKQEVLVHIQKHKLKAMHGPCRVGITSEPESSKEELLVIQGRTY